MTIIVCVKQVPAEEEVQIDPQKNTLIRGSRNMINRDDLNALEWALTIKNRTGAKVIVISMGPRQAAIALQSCLNLGADEAFLLCDEIFAGSDTLATALVLSTAIRKIDSKYSLLLCGQESSDGNTAQVGPEIGEFLAIPHVNNVYRADLLSDKVLVERKLGIDDEELEISLPCLLSIKTKGVIPRIVQTNSSHVRFLNAQELGLTEKNVGLSGSATQVLRTYLPKPFKNFHAVIDSKLPANKRIELILSSGMYKKKDQIKYSEGRIDFGILAKLVRPFIQRQE